MSQINDIEELPEVILSVNLKLNYQYQFKDPRSTVKFKTGK